MDLASRSIRPVICLGWRDGERTRLSVKNVVALVPSNAQRRLPLSVAAPANVASTKAATIGATAAAAAAAGARAAGAHADASKPPSETFARSPQRRAAQASAAAAGPHSPSSNWVEVQKEDGAKYYYHRVTRVVRWDKPDKDVMRAVEKRIDDQNAAIKERQEAWAKCGSRARGEAWLSSFERMPPSRARCWSCLPPA